MTNPSDSYSFGSQIPIRQWLLDDVPINVVSKWLGHANLQTTMVYLELVADPGGFMERVP